MKISKFGGSSVARPEGWANISKVAEDEDRKILVFSALGKRNDKEEKVTDLLIGVYNEFKLNGRLVLDDVKGRFRYLVDGIGIDFDLEGEFKKIQHEFLDTPNYDYLLSRGEFLTAKIYSIWLGLPFLPSEELLFFKGERVDFEKTKSCLIAGLEKFGRFVTGGFYGSDEAGGIKLLPRGGGDLSGGIFARVIDAQEYEVFTDVEGIKQINPCFGGSETLERLSYQQLNFMTKLDANVLQKECGKILTNTKTKIRVRGIFDLSKKGTVIAKGLSSDKGFISFDRPRGVFYFVKNRKIKKFYQKDLQKMIKML